MTLNTQFARNINVSAQTFQPWSATATSTSTRRGGRSPARSTRPADPLYRKHEQGRRDPLCRQSVSRVGRPTARPPRSGRCRGCSLKSGSTRQSSPTRGRSNTVFDVKIFRIYTTYQFSPRLQLRNIIQRNTFANTLDANVLMTYRVNWGTAIYLGYDDHYAQGLAINAETFPGTRFGARIGRSSPRCNICSDVGSLIEGLRNVPLS